MALFGKGDWAHVNLNEKMKGFSRDDPWLSSSRELLMPNRKDFEGQFTTSPSIEPNPRSLRAKPLVTVVNIHPFDGAGHIEYSRRRAATELGEEIKAVCPECANCPHKIINEERIKLVSSMNEELRIHARCGKPICVRDSMRVEAMAEWPEHNWTTVATVPRVAEPADPDVPLTTVDAW